MINEGGGYQMLTKNEEQAKEVLALIFSDDTSDDINSHLFDWIEQHPESAEINKFLERFPELEQSYTLNDFLDPDSRIPGWANHQNVRAATFFGISIVIAECAWELFGEKIHQGQANPWKIDSCSEQYEMAARIISTVDINLVMAALYSTLICTVGEKYYGHYLHKLGDKSLSEREMIELMETERLLNPDSDLIILATYMRVLLDACFFLFRK